MKVYFFPKAVYEVQCSLCQNRHTFRPEELKMPVSSMHLEGELPEGWRAIGEKTFCPAHDIQVTVDGQDFTHEFLHS